MTTLAEVKATKNVGKDRHVMSLTLEYLQGNKAPYFSATVDTFNGTKLVACGCQHNIIRAYFPDYEKYLKWHLVSTIEPMHYLANGLYWLKEGNIPNFKHTVVWGEVETDQDFTSDWLENYALFSKYANKSTHNPIQEYLVKRLPALMDKFEQDMTELFDQPVTQIDW